MKFITSNRGKFNEMEHMLSGFQLQQHTIEYPEVQTDSLEAVIQFALSWLQPRVDGSFFVEDAGLFVEALDGFPGVYSAYAFRTIGNPGILQLLLEANNRAASFKSVIGLYDGEPHVFEGVCQGRIAFAERGGHGFGYDPIFMPAQGDTTFGEMTTTEKNTLSHRGKAAAKLLSYLQRRDRTD